MYLPMCTRTTFEDGGLLPFCFTFSFSNFTVAVAWNAYSAVFHRGLPLIAAVVYGRLPRSVAVGLWWTDDRH